MDTTTATLADDTLYECDFYEWCEQQAARLRAGAKLGANDGLDYENLAEEIESLGKSQRREIRSRLRVLLSHLLKWRHQTELRGNSWTATINLQRQEIDLLLQDSPSLVSFAHGAVVDVYPNAVKDAVCETGLGVKTFPAVCPFSGDQVFDPEFLPADLDAAS